MAELRKDSCLARLPPDERGKSSFRGQHLHTGIKIGEQPPWCSVPINDIYGTHVVFGDEPS